MNRRRKAVFCVVASCLAMIHPHETRADQYQLDMSHTSIIFGISHFNYSFTYGRFNNAKGDFVWNEANPSGNHFRIAIETASIDTNDPKRDGHLRNADFFNASQFPQITFISTAINPLQKPGPGGATHNVTGNLTMHGVTKQITLPMKKLGAGPGPYGKFRRGFFCQVTLKRSDFGMTNMIPPPNSNQGISDEVAITISFEGIRKETANPASPSGSDTNTGTSLAPQPINTGQAPATGSGSAPQASSGTR